MKTLSVAPLTFQQEEMLRHMREHPECAYRYDVIRFFRLRGVPDLRALEGALGDVVRRHPALRTVMASSPAGVEQRILPALPAPLLSDGGERRSARELAAELVADRHGMDAVLAGAPLFRVGTFTVGAERYLSFTVHHLVCDGWSVGVLWRDLAECYAARLEGRAPRLPSLPMTYAGFAVEQRRTWPELAAAVLPFWKERAEGLPRAVDWPWPREASPGAPPNEVELHTLRVGAERLPALRDFARGARATPFMLLLAATAAGVARMSGQNDLLCGSDTADRESLDRHGVIGHFVNTRLVRVRVEPGVPFAALLRDVREFWLDAEEYREAYADKVLEAMGDPALTKINVLDFPGQGDDVLLRDLTAVPVSLPSADPFRHDLGVIWVAGAEGYTAHIIRKVSRVDRGAVEEMIRRIQALLQDPSAEL